MNFLKNKWVLFCTNLRWLSQGNMVRRVFELKKELLKFYTQRNRHSINHKFFLSRATYRIFLTLSIYEFVFQGPNSSIVYFISTLQASVRKLDLWPINEKAEQ